MFFGFIGFEVERELVNCPQADEGEFVAFVDPVFHLCLEIIVSRQEGQSDRFEEKLEIGTAGGDQIGYFIAGRSFQPIRSSRPSRCLKFITELRALPRFAGKAPL